MFEQIFSAEFYAELLELNFKNILRSYVPFTTLYYNINYSIMCLFDNSSDVFPYQFNMKMQLKITLIGRFFSTIIQGPKGQKGSTGLKVCISGCDKNKSSESVKRD